MAAAVLDAEEAAALELVVEAEHPLAAREEVARVLEEQEADEVGVEHRAEQLVALRQRAEDVGGGEGRVEEEADVGRAVAAEDVRRQQQQVVVVDPRHEAVVVHLHHLLGELLVHRAVRAVEVV